MKLKKTYAPKELKYHLNYMLYTLKNNKLRWKKVDSDYKKYPGTQHRQIEEENPKWYKGFCRMYITNRKKPRKRKDEFFDTKIKRRETINALEKLCVKGFTYSIYAEDLFEIAKEMIEEEKHISQK